MSVVFPTPDPPRRETNSPSRISKSNPSRILFTWPRLVISTDRLRQENSCPLARASVVGASSTAISGLVTPTFPDFHAQASGPIRAQHICSLKYVLEVCHLAGPVSMASPSGSCPRTSDRLPTALSLGSAVTTSSCGSVLDSGHKSTPMTSFVSTRYTECFQHISSSTGGQKIVPSISFATTVRDGTITFSGHLGLEPPAVTQSPIDLRSGESGDHLMGGPPFRPIVGRSRSFGSRLSPRR